MLKTMIDDQIPRMKDKLLAVMDATSSQLEDMGTAIRPDQAREIVLDECRKFSALAAEAILATKSLQKGFWHSVHTTFEDAKRKLEDCSPLFEVNGKLVGLNLGDGNGTGCLELLVDKESSWNGVCITSDEKLIGGALWCLEFADQKVRLICKKLPRGAKRIRTKYEVESVAAGNKLEGEVEFSENTGTNGFSLNQVPTEAFRVNATITVQVGGFIFGYLRIVSQVFAWFLQFCSKGLHSGS
jgi:hypothetical protein